MFVSERQAGEYRIEIGTRTSIDWFGPHNIQEPCTAFGNPECGTTETVGFYAGNRLFVGIQVSQFDRRTGQRFALINDTYRQVTRFAKRVGIALGHNLKRQSDSFDGARIGAPSTSPNADKHFGAAAVNFPAQGIGGSHTGAILQYRRQPFALCVIIEALGGQFGRRVVGLHGHYVHPGLRKNGSEMRPHTALLERAAQIDRAVGPDRLQHYNAPGIGLPPSAIVAVADQRRNRKRHSRLGLENLRLKPEIMRGGRRGKKNERQFGQGEVHGGKSPFDFICSLDFMSLAAGLSNSNWGKVRAAAGAVLLTALLATYSVPAYAHDEAGASGGVTAGFSHPFLGADHMLAMIAVGIWGAFLGKPLLVILPMVFPVMMTVGAALAMAALPFPPVELGIAISVITLGLLITTAARAAPIFACTVVAIFALFHGYAHGTELPSTADPVGYSVGFVFATGLLHLGGIALGMLKNVRFGELGLRAVGAATAAAGVVFLIAGLPQ